MKLNTVRYLIKQMTTKYSSKKKCLEKSLEGDIYVFLGTYSSYIIASLYMKATSMDSRIPLWDAILQEINVPRLTKYVLMKLTFICTNQPKLFYFNDQNESIKNFSLDTLRCKTLTLGHNQRMPLLIRHI